MLKSRRFRKPQGTRSGPLLGDSRAPQPGPQFHLLDKTKVLGKLVKNHVHVSLDYPCLWAKRIRHLKELEKVMDNPHHENLV